MSLESNSSEKPKIDRDEKIIVLVKEFSEKIDFEEPKKLDFYTRAFLRELTVLRCKELGLDIDQDAITRIEEKVKSLRLILSRKEAFNHFYHELGNSYKKSLFLLALNATTGGTYNPDSHKVIIQVQTKKYLVHELSHASDEIIEQVFGITLDQDKERKGTNRAVSFYVMLGYALMTFLSVSIDQNTIAEMPDVIQYVVVIGTLLSMFNNLFNLTGYLNNEDEIRARNLADLLENKQK